MVFTGPMRLTRLSSPQPIWITMASEFSESICLTQSSNTLARIAIKYASHLDFDFLPSDTAFSSHIVSAVLSFRIIPILLTFALPYRGMYKVLFISFISYHKSILSKFRIARCLDNTVNPENRRIPSARMPNCNPICAKPNAFNAASPGM